jgi:hypothetical protein
MMFQKSFACLRQSNSTYGYKIVLEYAPLIAKFQWSKFNSNWWSFKSPLYVKTLNLYLWIIFSFQMSFSYIKCAFFLLKIEEDLDLLMNKITTWVEIGEIMFITYFDFFCSNVFFVLNIINLENVFWTKAIHF